MARPKINADRIREDILDHAEALLLQSNGRRLVMSDIARLLGKSQPYVHAHFPTKSDLVAALARRWFSEVEQASAAALAAASVPSDRLLAHTLAVLSIKRSAFDRNPELFCAYLELAREHEDIVRAHADRLTEHLQSALVSTVRSDRLADAVERATDMLAQFRVPHLIALKRSAATDERARRAVSALLVALSKPPYSAG